MNAHDTTMVEASATSLIASLFQGTSGSIAVRAGDGDPLIFPDLNAATAYAANAGDGVWLSLATRDPDTGARLQQRAIAAPLRLGFSPAVPPSLTMRHAEQGKWAIWLLREPLDVHGGEHVAEDGATESRYLGLDTLLQIVSADDGAGIEDGIPFPGTGGWELCGTGEPRPYDASELHVTRMNDAIVWGRLEPDSLSREVAVSYSQHGAKTARGKARWTPWKTTLGDLLDRLTHHVEGDKDGLAILQGLSARGEREAKEIERLSVLILDLDTGESLDALRASIRREGWFAFIHSTHSHLKPVTAVKKDTVMDHVGKTEGVPTAEECLRYLREKKRYQEWALDGATLQGTQITGGVTEVLITHKPLPKYRVLFVLQEPFVPTQRGGKDSAGRVEWAERYAGVSERLGAFYDRACTDVSRLLFTARHPANATEWMMEIIPGKPLDLEQIERVKKHNDPFANAAKRLGGDREGMRFFGRFANQVDLESAFLAYDPDGDRGARSSGSGRTHRCPFEDEHSPTPDGSSDMGFFCVNADESETGGAVAKCMHDSCAERDRVDFTAKLLEDAGKDWEDLKRDFVPAVEEDGEEDKEPPAAPTPKAKRKARRGGDEFAADNVKLFEEFSAEWKYVAEGAGGRFVRVLPDGNLEFRSVEALVRRYAHKPVVFLDANGKPKERPLVTEWLRWSGSEEHKFDGLRFAPGKADKDITPYLNTWRGLGVVPRAGSWARLRTHLEEVVANGNEKDARFLIGWMAYVLQHLGDPRGKLAISPVIRGEEGAGKSIVFDYYRRIFGRHGVVLSKPEQIVGRFNASLAEALVVQLEEAFFAGDPRIDGPLKDLLTGRELTIERKNVDPVSAPNFAHFVVISNAERPVPIHEGSRRYYPIEVSDRKANDATWFDPIVAEMENGGVEAMAFDLFRWAPPNADWGFLREFPRTEAGDRMIAAGLSPLERFILEWAHADSPDYDFTLTLKDDGDTSIPTTKLAEAFRLWVDDNVRRRSERENLRTDVASVGIRLKAMLPEVGKAHGEAGNARLFPPRGRVVEMLRMHPNGGYRAFLNRLTEG